MSKETQNDIILEKYRNESFFEYALREKNLRSAHNLIVGGLLWVVIQNVMDDHFYDGGSQYGFKLIFQTWRSFPVAILWMSMLFVVHLSIFFYWKLRIRFKGITLIPNLGWNHFWAACACFQLFGLWNFIGLLCIKYNISVACRILMQVQYLVLAMKGYSFIRINMVYLEEKGKEYILPTFSHYLYFTFVPTAIYKDTYQRSTTKRNWKKLFKHVFELIACIYLLTLLSSKYVSKHLQDFGKEPFTITDVVYLCWSFSLTCFLIILLCQDLLLNCSQNFFAELVGFGERQYFTDWWTCANISEFYLKWNKYIQDYLFIHVYKDFYDNVAPGNKAVAKSAVFVISIIFHELVVLYWFEIILLPFAFFMIISLTQSSWPKTGNFYNFLMLFQMFIGMGFVFGSLHIEYFAKQNCPNRPDSIIYFPRIFSCDINS